MRLCQKYVIAILVMFMQLSALAQDQQDQDVFVIYFRSPITYDENVYRSDKEAFINQLTPIKALKYKVSTIDEIEKVPDAFVQIVCKGFNDIILDPFEFKDEDFEIKLISKGMKHLPGRVVYTDGTPLPDIRVEMKSQKGDYEVISYTDQKGLFVSQVTTSQDYEVKLFRDQKQIHHSFEFDPENFDNLVIDLPLDDDYNEIRQKIPSQQEIKSNDAGMDPGHSDTLVVLNDVLDSVGVSDLEIDFQEGTMAEERASAKEKSEPTTINTKPVPSSTETNDKTVNYYVIAGTFRILDLAQKRVDLLKENGFKGAHLIQDLRTKLFKVASHSLSSLEDARDLETKIETFVGDAYILNALSSEFKKIEY